MILSGSKFIFRSLFQFQVFNFIRNSTSIYEIYVGFCQYSSCVVFKARAKLLIHQHKSMVRLSQEKKGRKVLA